MKAVKTETAKGKVFDTTQPAQLATLGRLGNIKPFALTSARGPGEKSPKTL